jgi:hypothetical protein
MAAIRATITIDLPDDIDYNHYINDIRFQLSRLTGLDTRLSVREVDDPISLSPIRIGKIKE